MERTSLTHPLQIATVEVGPGQGRLGITFAPGKVQADGMSGAWRRDLTIDLDAIVAWGARVVVTLVEPTELRELRIERLGQEIIRRDMEWIHLPIRDYGVPGPAFEQEWPDVSASLCRRLAAGDSVLIHCKGGLGRAGMVAVRLLVEAGWPPNHAVAEVREVRPGAIETPEQMAWARQGRMS